MAYLEELLPEFRKGAKIRRADWGERCYIRRVEGGIVTAKGNPYNPTWQDLDSGLWEFYKDPEPDWQYIIDNRCLCYFWDENFNWAMYGTLGKIEKGGEYRFTMFDEAGCRSSYKNCRPVRRDEVTFYEDKKDED